jgi:pimeloyl-ACP methyl ester carboxylesterase
VKTIIPAQPSGPEHLSIHGSEMTFRQAGSGPALLLVHGMASRSDTWEQVMAPLARDHLVLAPDLVGQGASANPAGDYSLGAHAARLRDFMSVVGMPRATVVGHSLGGGIAMQFAYQFPDLCDRLVLVSSGGLGREVSWLLRLLSLPGVEYALPIICPRFVRDRGDEVLRLLRRAGLRHAAAAEMWRAYTSLSEPGSRRAFARTLSSVVDPGGQSVSALDRLYLIAGIPTLIIWGDQDNIIPVSHAHAAHEALPGSRLEIIHGAGHLPHVQDPDRFVDVLADFIATSQPSTITPEQRRMLMLTHNASAAPRQT